MSTRLMSSIVVLLVTLTGTNALAQPPYKDVNSHLQRYGLIGSWQSTEETTLGLDLGVRSVRVGVSWADTEHFGPIGPYSPNDGRLWYLLDRQLDELNRSGVPVAIYLTVGGDMPGWAAPGPKKAPYDFAWYGEFFEAVVRHIQDQWGWLNIVYGVWNEPNLDEYLEDDDIATVYSQLFAQASAARDRVSPYLRLGGPETSFHAVDPGCPYCDYFFQAAFRIYPYMRPWDVITGHYYTDAQDLYGLFTLSEYVEQLDWKSGREHEIWITEAGAHTEASCGEYAQLAKFQSLVGELDTTTNWRWRKLFFYQLGPVGSCSDLNLARYENGELYLTQAYGWLRAYMTQRSNDISMTVGHYLQPNNAIYSPNGYWFLWYKTDGSLGIYSTWDGLLRTSIVGPGSVPDITYFDYDGNLIVYSSVLVPEWVSWTQFPGAYVSLRNSGSLVIAKPNGDPLWRTHQFWPWLD